jgi:microsomal epoxide hydrolase
MTASPKPFTLQVPEAVLQDLRDRVRRARWPDEPPVPPWTTGTSLAWLRELVDHWAGGFDWPAQQARLNAFEQYTVPLAGIRLHFLHVRGEGSAPMPLLLSHGWPGSVFEFLRLIPLLTHPSRYGGSEADAFTVVAPSLPGYGLSFEPGQTRFGVEEMADAYIALMRDVLGYSRWGTQGGDWGAFVTSRMAYLQPQRTTGLHLNFLPLRRDPGWITQPSPAEQRYLDELAVFLKEETGYQWIQGTRPQTLAYALTDSPVGLAAWISEKFQRWTDCNGDPLNAVPREELLANITLYWASGAIGSSFGPYYARMHRPWPLPEGAMIEVPMGHAAFPKEIVRPPRSLAQRVFTDIRRWTEMPRGGHFAAMEQPQALAEEIRAFFRPLRIR